VESSVVSLAVLWAALLAATLEVLLRDARPLMSDEIREAKKVFGNSLNYGIVRVAE
jgi:hypothetical protein